jgi:glycine dehydrogenase subunit 1
VQLAERLAKVKGVAVVNETFFNEFTLRLPASAAPVVEKLARAGVLAGVPLSRFYPDDAALANLLVVAATETTTDEDMDSFKTKLAQALS